MLEHSGYEAALRAQKTLEAEGRLENLEELVGVAQEFDERRQRAGEEPRLQEFLQEVSLFTDTDALVENEAKITLMTLHNAKGLEFPVVFITGMEEGVFPHQRSLDEQNIEEERRLAYVGITRAMRRLYLVHARARNLWGSALYGIPSRFLGELPSEQVQKVTVGQALRYDSASGGWDTGPVAGPSRRRGRARRRLARRAGRRAVLRARRPRAARHARRGHGALHGARRHRARALRERRLRAAPDGERGAAQEAARLTQGRGKSQTGGSSGGPASRGWACGARLRRIRELQSEDVTVVRAVADGLIAAGARVWFAEYEILLSGRERFQERIDEGIQRSAYGLVFTNDRFVGSPYCRRELDQLLEFAGPERIMEITLPREEGPHRRTLRSSEATRFDLRDPDGILRRAGARLGISPVERPQPRRRGYRDPAGHHSGTKGQPEAYQGLLLGRPYRIALGGWTIEKDPNRDPRYAGWAPEFKYAVKRPVLFVNVVAGAESRLKRSVSRRSRATGRSINSSSSMDRVIWAHSGLKHVAYICYSRTD